MCTDTHFFMGGRESSSGFCLFALQSRTSSNYLVEYEYTVTLRREDDRPPPSPLREPLRAHSGQAIAAAAVEEFPREMTCLVVDAQGIPGLQLTGCVCRGLVSRADEQTDPPWHGRERRGRH